jgi:hypothetical protein
MNIKQGVCALLLAIHSVQAMELPPANIENPNATITINNDTDIDYTLYAPGMKNPIPVPAGQSMRGAIGRLFIDAPAGSPNYAKGKEATLSLDSATSHKKIHFSYIKQGDNSRLFSGSLGQQDILEGNTVIDFNIALDENINIKLDIKNSTLNITKKYRYLPIQIYLNNQSLKTYTIHFESTTDNLSLPAHAGIIFNPREYLHSAINIISFMIRDEKSKLIWVVKIADLKKDSKTQLTVAIFSNKNERLSERSYILNPEEIHEEVLGLIINIEITDRGQIFIESISEKEEIR